MMSNSSEDKKRLIWKGRYFPTGKVAKDWFNGKRSTFPNLTTGKSSITSPHLLG
jgi:hypothetical protein